MPRKNYAPYSACAAGLEIANMKSVTQALFPPLETITRPTVNTAAAAYYLNRRPQTLRVYALTGKPIQPVRFNGRLAWPVSEIKRVLGVV